MIRAENVNTFRLWGESVIDPNGNADADEEKSAPDVIDLVGQRFPGVTLQKHKLDREQKEV